MQENRREGAVELCITMLLEEELTCASASALFPLSDTRGHSSHQPSITSKTYLEPTQKAVEEPL